VRAAGAEPFVKLGSLWRSALVVAAIGFNFLAPLLLNS
jgi:hypothetical protein